MSANVTNKNKALVRRAVNEIWNKGDLDVVDELTDPNYVGHLPGTEEIRGPEGIKEAVRLFRSTFPDLKFSIESQVAEGDEVVTTLTLRGKHTGELKSRG